jgi:hypothetical protein
VYNTRESIEDKIEQHYKTIERIEKGLASGRLTETRRIAHENQKLASIKNIKALENLLTV